MHLTQLTTTADGKIFLPAVDKAENTIYTKRD